MKIAIFGATGFLGYDFVKALLADGSHDFTVYSSSAKNMSNISRHDIDIRLVTPAEYARLDLDIETDFIVNFAHPFGVRDEMNPKEQLDAFREFIERQKTRSKKLRLIHLSTMSVYEPFDKPIEYDESSVINPPYSDSYALDKAYIETKLLELPAADDWQLHLRPTVVYGPFCRPWTDRIFMALMGDGIRYNNAEGRIQPVYGADITRFIMKRLGDFTPGVYNFGGTEKITWLEFFEYFREIAKQGDIIHDPEASPSEFDASTGILKFYGQNIKSLIKVIVKDPSFDRMAVPLAKRLPRKFVIWVRDLLIGKSQAKIRKSPTLSFFATPFFSQDRLVSMGKFKEHFSDSEFTSMKDNIPEMREYYEYRFTEKTY